MHFRRDDLQIKIGSLADEARRIRQKEETLKYRAFRRRTDAIVKAKGIDDKAPMPDDLREEMKRRSMPLVANKAPEAIAPKIERVCRKAIRKWLRHGMTKEEILALPGVQASLRFEPRIVNLHMHRKGVVRHEARHSQLAYAFLRNRPYAKTEDKANSHPNWLKVSDIAKRFSNEDERHVMQRFAEWEDTGKEFIRGREVVSGWGNNSYPIEAYRV
jgi:hypothetical protein